MNSRWRQAVVTAGLALLVSCGAKDAALSTSASYFAGLDRAVVAEVVASPTVREKLDGEPAATRASMAQGIARNFVVCRDTWRVYRTWRTSGDLPELAPLPAVTVPAEPSNAQWLADFARLTNMVSASDLDGIRSFLTATGSCGEWIPTEPGGPTIKAAVEKLS